jgi:hypothetical protein
MITEDYVSSEIAKLLKEKGFDEKSQKVYMHNGQLLWAQIFMEGESFINNKDIDLVANYNDWNIYTQGEYAYLCPTLQMAMKWLREEHNLFIQVTIVPHTTITMEQKYYLFSIHKDRRRLRRNDVPTNYYNTYEQACEIAIKYCLKNIL